MKINLASFQGGEAIDYKNGIANSFYYSQSLDFRSRISQMSVLPGPTQTALNINDLVTAMEQDPSGNRYTVGASGNIGKINTSGVYSPLANLSSNGAAAIVYNQQSDTLYIPGQQTVSTYGKLSSSPTFLSDNFAQSVSDFNGVVYLYDAVLGGYGTTNRNTAAASYSVPTVLVESQLCAFAPDIEPFYSIKVKILAKGTGDWTLTLHDSQNHSLAAVTIVNASLTNAAYNEFIFTAPGIRAFTGQIATGNSAAYHFHLTSTVNDGTAYVVTAGDLTGCDFLLYAYRLIQTNNGWHPAVNFSGKLCIGNGQYLSTYNYSNDAAPNNRQWQRNALILDAGYEVCGLTINNQYLVIAAEKRSTSTSKLYQDGRLYFWDGSNAQPNFIIDVPMGAPYSVYTANNITYFYCAGSLFAWGGGQTIIKVRYMAYQNTDYLGVSDNTIVNPNMMDMRYNLLMLGYPSVTTNVNTPVGVYSWGSTELSYPNSFGLSYTLSNGLLNYSSSNQLQIGMIKNFVDTMYISWKYVDTGGVTRYGLDIVDPTSNPATTFQWDSLIWDGGVRYKTKQAMRYKINFLAWPAGCTLTPTYTLDRGTKQLKTTYSPATGATSVVVELTNARCREVQWGFTGTCTGATPPTFTGITMEIDPLSDEIDIRNPET